jgi:hypothetical protein
MRIELQPRYKSAYCENTVLRYQSRPTEKSLTKALGALDDGNAEAIEIPNHVGLSPEMIENFLVPDVYKVTY